MTTAGGGTGDLGAKVAELRRAFESLDPSANPDEWAYAAIRLATALAEMVDSAASLQEPIGLLTKAQRVFSPDRAPVEHGRIATILGTCFRRVGDASTALSHMDVAARLLRGRVSVAEHAAADSNLATALMETGRLSDALVHADLAVDALSKIELPSAAELRSLIAAHLNRGLIRQAIGHEFEEILGDFNTVIRLSSGSDSVLQRGMAHHAIGVLQKSTGNFVDAMRDFGLAASLLPASSFPMQHAICRFNMGLTLEAMGGLSNLRFALRELGVSLNIFDQRLHPAQRAVALEARSRVVAELAAQCPGMSMSDHQILMLVELSDGGRQGLLREMISGLEPLPATVRAETLLDICDSLVERPESKQLLLVLMSVLMEFPDAVLADALSALVASIDDHGRREVLTIELDEVIHTVLHGPQRVRVRDILEYFGWERP